MSLDSSKRWLGLDIEDYLFHSAKYASALFFALLVLIPLFFVISVSFRNPENIFGSPIFFPKEPTLETWIRAFRDISPYMWNSLLIATGTAAIALVITIPSAYVFGRLQFPGKRPLFLIIIISLMFPYIILIIPISNAWIDLGLYNTLPGLWFAHQAFVTPFAVWILRDFFAKLPKNLEEAAQVYGCTQFTAFLRVILPISIPALVAVGFLAFLSGWNDFLFANMITTSAGPRPAIVQLYISINSGTGERVSWGLLMAESIMVGTPVAVLYFVSQRFLKGAFAQ